MTIISKCSKCHWKHEEGSECLRTQHPDMVEEGTPLNPEFETQYGSLPPWSGHFSGASVIERVED